MSRIAIGAIGGHLVVVLFPGAMQHSRLGTLSSGTWFGVFDRWDASYYTTIAAHGYPNAPAPLRVFFPGYPLVVRVAHDLTGGALTYNQAGCIVSWSAMVAVSILLYGLVDRRFGSRAALVSVVLFCWFPTSCFLLAPYSEALFILEILIVVTLIERGGWWPAALVSGFASATSPEGVVLAIAIAIAALIGCRGLWRTVGYGLVSIWGLAAYTVFLGVRFSDPLAYVTEEGNWHRLTRFPFTGIVHNIGSIRHVMDERGPVPAGYRFVRTNIAWAWIVNDAMVVVAAAALVYLVVITVRVRRADTGPRAGVRVPIPWIVILAGVVGIVSVTSIRFAGTLTSTEGDARLISVAFPLYPALYLMTRRWQVAVVILMTASIGAALFVQAMFNLGYWVV
jgi:hypothetical protein